MRLLRLTRHDASPAQIQEIERLWGQDCEITQIRTALPSTPHRAVKLFDILAEGENVAEVVLPIGLLESVMKFSAFVKRGGIVVRANMLRELDEEEHPIFTFISYERILKVDVVIEKL